MPNKQATGIVTSNKGNKSITVLVKTQIQHKKYNKIIAKSNKYYAHDEQNICKIGDIVTIQQTRPISKNKRWTLINKIK